MAGSEGLAEVWYNWAGGKIGPQSEVVVSWTTAVLTLILVFVSGVLLGGILYTIMLLITWISSFRLPNSARRWNPKDNRPRVPDSENWEYPRYQLRLLSVLGEGCFGQVWKGQALEQEGSPSSITVAVKTLKENAGEREKRDLLSELEVMKKLDHHPNVVKLLGCCTAEEPVFLILEYVPHGTLLNYLRASRAEDHYAKLRGTFVQLTSRDLIDFSHQVANGMLHLNSRGIIHRDLAARNVLVGERNVCKIADFGFAWDTQKTDILENPREDGGLPIRWMAPESLYDQVFTTKTDVWSFGILMWEILTLGSTPYSGMSAGGIVREVRDGYRLERPDRCCPEVYHIIRQCWDRDPEKRPAFGQLTYKLDHLQASGSGRDIIDLVCE